MQPSPRSEVFWQMFSSAFSATVVIFYPTDLKCWLLLIWNVVFFLIKFVQYFVFWEKAVVTYFGFVLLCTQFESKELLSNFRFMHLGKLWLFFIINTSLITCTCAISLMINMWHLFVFQTLSFPFDTIRKKMQVYVWSVKFQPKFRFAKYFSNQVKICYHNLN